MPNNSTNCRDYSNLIGRRFGRLVIEEIIWGGRPRGCKLRCRCDCGNEKTILKNNVVNNRKHKTISCGCQQGRPNPNGITHKPEFKIWIGMIQRCENKTDAKTYSRYGGRGIVVCERWRQSFAAFYDDMGPRPSAKHSIDRINNNGNYEPDNCRWATRSEQQRNKRDSRIIECFGKRLTLAGWEDETGIYRKTIAIRIDKLRWPVDRALTEPSGSFKNRPTCPKGHLMDAKNTRRDKRGSRSCRTCDRLRTARNKKKRLQNGN